MKKHYFNKILPGNRTTLQIIKRGVISAGSLAVTDLEQWVFIENDDTRDPANNGKVYDLELLKKSADLKIAACTDTDREEFPNFPGFTDGVPLPLEVPARLPGFAPYCSKDFTSRVSLTGVYINLTGGTICATNGNIMREGVLSVASKGEYIASHRAAVFIKAMKREILLAVEINDQYLKLVYAGCDGDLITYYDKLTEGPYPMYAKVLPDRGAGHQTITGKSELQRIRDGLGSLQAYGTGYTKGCDLVIFSGGRCTWNAAHGYITVRNLPVIFEPSARQFSAAYILRILRDLPDGRIMVQSFEDNTRTHVFYSDNELFVIMPSRPPKDGENWPPTGKEITA